MGRGRSPTKTMISEKPRRRSLRKVEMVGNNPRRLCPTMHYRHPLRRNDNKLSLRDLFKNERTVELPTMAGEGANDPKPFPTTTRKSRPNHGAAPLYGTGDAAVRYLHKIIGRKRTVAKTQRTMAEGEAKSQNFSTATGNGTEDAGVSSSNNQNCP